MVTSRRTSNSPAGAKVFDAEFPTRSSLHLMRKTFHASMGITIAHGVQFRPHETMLGVMLFFVVGFAMGETARLNSAAFNRLQGLVFGPVMRAHEVNRISGIMFYVLGVLVAICSFPKPAVVLSILYLAIGDPLASAIGIAFGDKGPRTKWGKSLLGTAACLTINSFVTLAIATQLWNRQPTCAVIVFSVLSGSAGAVVELITARTVAPNDPAPIEFDDNLLIPIASSILVCCIDAITKVMPIGVDKIVAAAATAGAAGVSGTGM